MTIQILASQAQPNHLSRSSRTLASEDPAPRFSELLMLNQAATQDAHPALHHPQTMTDSVTYTSAHHEFCTQMRAGHEVLQDGAEPATASAVNSQELHVLRTERAMALVGGTDDATDVTIQDTASSRQPMAAGADIEISRAGIRSTSGTASLSYTSPAYRTGGSERRIDERPHVADGSPMPITPADAGSRQAHLASKSEGAVRAIQAMQSRMQSGSLDTAPAAISYQQFSQAMGIAPEPAGAGIFTGTTHRDAGMIAAAPISAPPVQPGSSAGISVPSLSFDGVLSSNALHTAQWASEFKEQVAGFIIKSGTGNHVIQLRLNPPELGPLQISLSIQDAVASASFLSPHASVRLAVEQALPQLQQLLGQSGLSLAQADVADQGAGHSAHAWAGRNSASQLTKAGSSGAGRQSDVAHQRASHTLNGLVDTFA